MGALSKLRSCSDKIIAVFLLRVLPQVLRLAILGIFVLLKYYKLFSSSYKYMLAINGKSLNFAYRKKVKPEVREYCSICLSEFEDGEEGRTLVECKHAFHKHCLEKWLRSYEATCPLCRSLVVPQVIVAEYRRMQIERKDNWIEKELAHILLNALIVGSGSYLLAKSIRWVYKSHITCSW